VVLRDPGVIWILFISLAAKCLSLSITVYISTRLEELHSAKKIPADKFSSLGGSIPYVEKGVVVMMPEEFE